MASHSRPTTSRKYVKKFPVIRVSIREEMRDRFLKLLRLITPG
jgi:hypothetical protein